MLRLNTTLVAAVGLDDTRVLSSLTAANVRVVLGDPEDSSLDQARHVLSKAGGVSTPYLLTDADPLAAVAEAWVQRFDQDGPIGDLEIAVAEAVVRWRAGAIEVPDYYLVMDAENLGRTQLHWYLGFLSDAAPNRVVAGSSQTSLESQLGSLMPGRWWPDLPTLLEGVESVVPDKVGLPASDETTTPTSQFVFDVR